VPLTWGELRLSLDPHSFHRAHGPQAPRELKADPWAGYWRCRQKLTLSSPGGRRAAKRSADNIGPLVHFFG
jgi:DNA primase